MVEVQEAQAEEARENVDGFEDIEAFTLVDNGGRVQAVFGYQEMESGTCGAYALLGKDCGRQMIELVRFMPAQLRRAMQAYGWKRAQLTVKKDFAAGKRFAEMLGFAFWAELPQFYGGNDYLLYEMEEEWNLI